jgi:(p)ppGpp synthase/HD superfamily hydrolase
MSPWRVRCSPRRPNGTTSCSTGSWRRWRRTTPTSIGTFSSGAYAFASEAHEHQQRRSGGDFILHALGVALILAEDTEGWRPLAESPAFAAALREEPAAEAA